jgi:hypothetical protein
MGTSYKQDIIIRDNNYVASLMIDSAKDDSDSKNIPTFKFIITGEGNEYRCLIKETSDNIERLQKALRNELSMSYIGKINDLGDLVILLNHPLIKVDDTYVLKKQNIDTSINSLFEHRIKAIQKKVIPKEYLITNDMFGPCYKVDCKMSHEILRKVFENNKYTLHKINKYYSFKYVYQETIPVLTKNQLMCPGILDTNASGSVVHEQSAPNIYTILSRKYNGDVVAIVTKIDNIVTFDALHTSEHLVCEFKNCPLLRTEYINKQQTTFTTKDGYFKYCYLIEMPFNIDDGIYRAYGPQKFYVLIRKNKMYINID